jgi:predicted RNA-binding protein YlqC (UPF0109 family)
MDIKSGTLVDWLQDQQEKNPQSFPGDKKVNYFKRFSIIEEYLNNEIHPHVNAGAMLHDDSYLTDHGPNHVVKVIKRATELSKSKECDLSPYEVYMLLTAIHFHDVGNIFGRQGHTLSAEKVMTKLASYFADETTEKRYIKKIAEAHGGKINGSKDTIGLLPPSDHVLNQTIRMQHMAAILRLADELSDDRSRSARFMVDSGLLPPKSEVYHRYANSLHTVLVDVEVKEIKMKFDMTLNIAQKKLKKGESQVYLLDYIFERTMKTFQESVYCGRFLRPYIWINNVNIEIEICSNNFNDVLQTIKYRLEESGYPEFSRNEIYKMCPDLKDWQGNGKLNGGLLARLIKNKTISGIKK